MPRYGTPDTARLLQSGASLDLGLALWSVVSWPEWRCPPSACMRVPGATSPDPSGAHHGCHAAHPPSHR
ncbi:hypothetical protein RA210_U10404 [Rubrivivax sp. A210]|nr:hypothetical protein RA210_U10404 [Rubrivivax sp. A210]